MRNIPSNPPDRRRSIFLPVILTVLGAVAAFVITGDKLNKDKEGDDTEDASTNNVANKPDKKKKPWKRSDALDPDDFDDGEGDQPRVTFEREENGDIQDMDMLLVGTRNCIQHLGDIRCTSIIGPAHLRCVSDEPYGHIPVILDDHYYDARKPVMAVDIGGHGVRIERFEFDPNDPDGIEDTLTEVCLLVREAVKSTELDREFLCDDPDSEECEDLVGGLQQIGSEGQDRQAMDDNMMQALDEAGIDYEYKNHGDISIDTGDGIYIILNTGMHLMNPGMEDPEDNEFELLYQAYVTVYGFEANTQDPAEVLPMVQRLQDRIQEMKSGD
ncbi:hypothetical protein KJ742_06930 [Patescibacteria group bacterium]|nr:hypothetical protein [Patescibacteria group bacterium]MBU1683646.1 hypothetical protein [Patescibacteria group bacterium]MBU1935063.1 hypothetical protein [Patescibacteria group bacterium]